MKTNTIKILILGLILSSATIQVNAQVQYNGCSVTGTYASAIGKSNIASGNNSFAGGYNSQATGSNSLAFGYNSKATKSTTTALGNTATASGVGSMAIGNYVKVTGQNAFAFGSGTTANYPLTNSTDNSIAFGVNSNKPTMLITKSLNNNYTGKVAIGQVTAPTAKLHIRSDNNEDAGVFIEPSNASTHKAFIKLFDDNHSISVDKTATMELYSGKGNLQFTGESYCFGMSGERKAHLYTSDIPSFYINATRVSGTESREVEGSSFAIDFNNGGVTFRSAIYQDPRGSEITNWNTSLLLCTDGKVGIGTKETYLENNSDNLKIFTPKTMDLQSNNITLSGKVGINTENHTNGYALAVDGGIISTKVFIKEVKLWPDYVFADDYQLMGLEDLKGYLNENRHLPGLPAEDEILQNGYDLNEMQTLMMEKIEEMTRYILLLQDEINELKAKTPSGDTIVFTYDDNGNRISRSLLFQKVTLPDRFITTAQPFTCDLFPNPTPGMFTVQVKELVKAHATLLTLNGVIIEEKDIVNGQTTFDLSEKPAGIYLLEIEGTDSHQTWKVIKR